jgi:hypothetical protein
MDGNSPKNWKQSDDNGNLLHTMSAGYLEGLGTRKHEGEQRDVFFKKKQGEMAGQRTAAVIPPKMGQRILHFLER